MPASTRAAAALRAPWHFETIRQCQLFVCAAEAAGPGFASPAVDAFVARLPPASGALETAHQRLLLLELSLRLSERLHARLQHPRSSGCRCAPAGATAAFWAALGPGTPPAEGFRRWFREFRREMCLTHTAAPVHLAAAWLREEPRRRLDTARAAREAGLTPAQLRRQFRAAFGMPMREYRTRVRAAHAVRLIAAGGAKIDAIARECGFGSRRGFYRAIHALTSCRPRELRGLAAPELDALTRAIDPWGV